MKKSHNLVDRHLKAHEDGIRSLLFTKNDKWLFSGSLDGEIKLWKRTFEFKLNLVQSVWHTEKNEKFSVRTMALMNNDRLLATGSTNYSIRIWGLNWKATRSKKTPMKIIFLKGQMNIHKNWIQSMVYSSKFKILFTGSDDTTISYFESISGAKSTHYNVSFLRQHVRGVLALVLTRNDSLLFSAGKDAKICMYSIKGPRSVRLLHKEEEQKMAIRTLKTCTRGHFLFSAGYDDKISVWKIEKTNFYMVRFLWQQHNTIMDLMISRNSRFMLSCGKNKKVVIWEVKDRYKNPRETEPEQDIFEAYNIKELRDNEGFIYAMATDSNENMLVTGSADFTINVYDLRNIFELHESKILQKQNLLKKKLMLSDFGNNSFNSPHYQNKNKFKRKNRKLRSGSISPSLSNFNIKQESNRSRSKPKQLTWEKMSANESEEIIENQISRLLQNIKNGNSKDIMEQSSSQPRTNRQTASQRNRPPSIPKMASNVAKSQRVSPRDQDSHDGKSNFSKEDADPDRMIMDIMDQISFSNENPTEMSSDKSVSPPKQNEDKFAKKPKPMNIIENQQIEPVVANHSDPKNDSRKESKNDSKNDPKNDSKIDPKNDSQNDPKNDSRMVQPEKIVTEKSCSLEIKSIHNIDKSSVQTPQNIELPERQKAHYLPGRYKDDLELITEEKIKNHLLNPPDDKLHHSETKIGRTANTFKSYFHRETPNQNNEEALFFENENQTENTTADEIYHEYWEFEILKQGLKKKKFVNRTKEKIPENQTEFLNLQKDFDELKINLKKSENMLKQTRSDNEFSKRLMQQNYEKKERDFQEKDQRIAERLERLQNNRKDLEEEKTTLNSKMQELQNNQRGIESKKDEEMAKVNETIEKLKLSLEEKKKSLDKKNEEIKHFEIMLQKEKETQKKLALDISKTKKKEKELISQKKLLDDKITSLKNKMSNNDNEKDKKNKTLKTKLKKIKKENINLLKILSENKKSKKSDISERKNVFESKFKNLESKIDKKNKSQEKKIEKILKAFSYLLENHNILSKRDFKKFKTSQSIEIHEITSNSSKSRPTDKIISPDLKKRTNFPKSRKSIPNLQKSKTQSSKITSQSLSLSQNTSKNPTKKDLLYSLSIDKNGIQPPLPPPIRTLQPSNNQNTNNEIEKAQPSTQINHTKKRTPFDNPMSNNNEEHHPRAITPNPRVEPFDPPPPNPNLNQSYHPHNHPQVNNTFAQNMMSIASYYPNFSQKYFLPWEYSNYLNNIQRAPHGMGNQFNEPHQFRRHHFANQQFVPKQPNGQVYPKQHFNQDPMANHQNPIHKNKALWIKEEFQNSNFQSKSQMMDDPKYFNRNFSKDNFQNLDTQHERNELPEIINPEHRSKYPTFQRNRDNQHESFSQNNFRRNGTHIAKMSFENLKNTDKNKDTRNLKKKKKSISKVEIHSQSDTKPKKKKRSKSKNFSVSKYEKAKKSRKE